MNKKIIISGILLWLFFLVATLPARLVLHWLPANLPITASGVDGTLWRGQAAVITVNRQTVTNVEWGLNPLWLFTGKIGGSISIDDPGISAEGGWRLGFDQTVYLSDMTVTVEAQRLSGYLPVKGIALEGKVRADIESLAYHPKSGPFDVEARLYWLKSAAAIAGPVIKLGNFTLKAQSSEDGAVRLTLQKAQNLLDAQGDILIRWNKDITLNLSVTEQVPEQLQSTIAFLKPDNKGRRQLQMTMPFKP
jgi:general secretion pathway protein N